MKTAVKKCSGQRDVVEENTMQSALHLKANSNCMYWETNFWSAQAMLAPFLRAAMLRAAYG
jgi:hypothetical protein